MVEADQMPSFGYMINHPVQQAFTVSVWSTLPAFKMHEIATFPKVIERL